MYIYNVPRQVYLFVAHIMNLIDIYICYVAPFLLCRQFWCLWLALGCNITAGIGIMSCAPTMVKVILGLR